MSNPKKHSIGIVIPTIGGRERYIEKTIRSCKSVSHSYVVLAGPPEVVRFTPGAGLCDLLITNLENLSLESKVREAFLRLETIADVVMWVGDDDYVFPSQVDMAVQLMHADSSLSFVYGNCLYVGSDDLPLFVSRPGKVAHKLLDYLPQTIPQPSCLFRLEYIKTSEAMNSDLLLAFDLDLLLRLRAAGPVKYVDATLSAWRWHSGSLTIRNRRLSATEAMKARRSNRSFGPAKNLFLFPFDELVRAGTIVGGHGLNYFMKFLKMLRSRGR